MGWTPAGGKVPPLCKPTPQNKKRKEKEITMKVTMFQSHSQLLNFWAQRFKESFQFTVIDFLQTCRIPLWVLQRHNHEKF
jgi:hypothetical protein